MLPMKDCHFRRIKNKYLYRAEGFRVFLNVSKMNFSSPIKTIFFSRIETIFFNY